VQTLISSCGQQSNNEPIIHIDSQEARRMGITLHHRPPSHLDDISDETLQMSLGKVDYTAKST